MKSFLFTKFSPKFVKESILPKLKSRGIDVVKIDVPKHAVDVITEKADSVLFMHEMSSHSEDRTVRMGAEKYQMPVICISRKASFWGDRLPPVVTSEQPKTELPENRPETQPGTAEMQKEENMPKTAITDENLQKMLHEYIRLRDEGADQEKMLGSLKKYWPHGFIRNYGHLQNNMHNIRVRPNVPEFFREWEKKRGGIGEITRSKSVETRCSFLASLSDEELERILKTTAVVLSKGLPYKFAFENVKHVWEEGYRPTDATVFNKFIWSVTKSTRCPEWFMEFYKTRKLPEGMDVSTILPKPENVDTDLPETVVDTASPETVDVALPEKTEEMQLAELFAEENRILKNEIVQLKDELAKTNVERPAPVTDASDVKSRLKDVFASCNKLRSLGVISSEEMLSMISSYVEKL